MSETPPTTLGADVVSAETCPHCEARPGAPCINFGAPADPMPAAFEFHAQRAHAAAAERRRREINALLDEDLSPGHTPDEAGR